MDSTKLTQYYDNLKSRLDDDSSTSTTLMKVGDNMSHPGSVAYINRAQSEADKLTDNCCKHVILDIYCKILPLDQSYISGNMGQMKSDIDSMLANKGMTASQYITSCHESTNAPMVDFIVRATESIGRSFMEEAKETLKDAQKNGIDVPPPEAPSMDDENINDQIVGVENDTEYAAFIGKLKKATENQIVNEITEELKKRKETEDMTFKTPSDSGVATESTISIALDFLNLSLMNEKMDVSAELQENMIGMAIRESTMNIMDNIFKLPGADLKSYRTRVLLGKGNIINEAAANYFIESGNKRFEPLYKEVDGNKYDVSNYEKVDKDGKKTPMTDQEAKSILDPEGYKGYQNRDKK